MRKRIWIVALWCLTIWLTTACMHGDVPPRIQAFISQYFPDSSIVLVETDNDDEMGQEYKVLLNDGTKIEFDLQGDWERVGRQKTGVPEKLIPPVIKQYLKTQYPNDVVTKLSKKPYGFKIELSSDMDLRFNAQGQFMEEID